MTIRAARIDAQGIYQGIDELADEGALTELHLPLITACDLAVGEYKWIPTDNPMNEYGGAFFPVAWLQKLAPGAAEQLGHI